MLSLKHSPYALGQIYGITIGILILDSLSSGDWRLYLIILAIPTFIVAILVLVLLEVSPRYALLMGDIDQGIIETQKMMDQNGVDLSGEAKYENWQEKLKNWAQSLREVSAYGKKESYSDLFKGKYAHITPVLWVAWFTDVFVYYGLIFMVPYTIQQ